MRALKPFVEFDPARTFYPLVIGYLEQMHGYLELASRALRDQVEGCSEEQKAALVAGVDTDSSRPFVARTLAGGKTELIGQPEFASITGVGIKVDTDTLAKEIFNFPDSSFRYSNLVPAGGLLILAWEKTKAAHTRHEYWEFLRHCRNAAAHRGVFTFQGKEPRFPAGWRGLSVKRGMQGTSLFANPPTPGFLGGGDVLYLLADIEKAFPNA